MIGLSTSNLPRIVSEMALNGLLQSSVLLALGLLAGRLLRPAGAAVQSVIYRVSLAAVLASPLVSAAVLATGVEGLRIHLTAPIPVVPPTQPNSTILPANAPPRPPSPEFPATPTLLPSASPSKAPPQPSPAPSTSNRSKSSLSVKSILTAFLCLWSLGCAFLLFRLILSHQRLTSLRRRAVPVEPSLDSLTADLARALHVAPPRVLRVPYLTGPCLCGLIRPTILLTDSDDDPRDPIAHELAHLARRDLLWHHLLQAACAPALAPTPALAPRPPHRVHRRGSLRRHRRLPRLRPLPIRQPPPRNRRALPHPRASGVAMVALRSLLARRVTRILDASRTLSTRAGRLALTSTLTAGLLGTTLTALLAVGRADEPPTPMPSLMATTTVPHIEESNNAQPDDDVPAPLTGRILDLEGHPVPDVQVHISNMSKPKTGDLTPWIDAIRQGDPPGSPTGSSTTDSPPKNLPRDTTTDADGRFHFAGLPPERLLTLELKAPSLAYTELQVLTRPPEKPIPSTGGINRYGPGPVQIYGSGFTCTATPSRPIEGLVLDSKTRKPLEGVIIRSSQFSGAYISNVSNLSATSDASGHYRLEGMPRGDGNELLVIPPLDQPYFMRELNVPNPPGLDPVPLDIDLHRGFWITGTVTDARTDAPLARVRIFYLPFRDNPFAQANPTFGRNATADGLQSRYATDADGHFRLPGLPGHAILGASDPQRPLPRRPRSSAIPGLDRRRPLPHLLQPRHPRPLLAQRHEGDQPVRRRRIHLRGPRPRPRRLRPPPRPRPLRPAPSPTSRSAATPSATTPTRSSPPTSSSKTSRTTKPARSPSATPPVHLGHVLNVRPGDDANGPISVTLEPTATITGHVLDPSGLPLSGARRRGPPQTRARLQLALPTVATDPAGRFLIPDVPPGTDYTLAISHRLPNGQQSLHLHRRLRPPRPNHRHRRHPLQARLNHFTRATPRVAPLLHHKHRQHPTRLTFSQIYHNRPPHFPDDFMGPRRLPTGPPATRRPSQQNEPDPRPTP